MNCSHLESYKWKKWAALEPDLWRMNFYQVLRSYGKKDTRFNKQTHELIESGKINRIRRGMN